MPTLDEIRRDYQRKNAAYHLALRVNHRRSSVRHRQRINQTLADASKAYRCYVKAVKGRQLSSAADLWHARLVAQNEYKAQRRMMHMGHADAAELTRVQTAFRDADAAFRTACAAEAVRA